MENDLKQTFETDIDENTDLTADYMEKINKSFFLMLKNPTEKEIEKHRKIRDALIAAWLASFFKDFEEQLYNSAQKGIDEADKQLKAKGSKDGNGGGAYKDKKGKKGGGKDKPIYTKDEKKVPPETFENQVKQRLASDKEDIALVSQNIKTNSENAIKQLNTSIAPVSYDPQKVKQISSDLAADLLQRGISFFYDRAGRRWSIAEYINMKTMTETISAERLSFFTRAVQYGVDLVRIVHLNLHPHCKLCEPFTNKILSLTGNTPGFMTIQEAAMQGLFHPRCDDVPEQLELAPEDNGQDGIIELNEANKKRYEYNKKRGVSL